MRTIYVWGQICMRTIMYEDKYVWLQLCVGTTQRSYQLKFHLSTSSPDELVFVFLLRFEPLSSPRGLNMIMMVILMMMMMMMMIMIMIMMIWWWWWHYPFFWRTATSAELEKVLQQRRHCQWTFETDIFLYWLSDTFLNTFNFKIWSNVTDQRKTKDILRLIFQYP